MPAENDQNTSATSDRKPRININDNECVGISDVRTFGQDGRLLPPKRFISLEEKLKSRGYLNPDGSLAIQDPNND